jgi:hypothetical protein
VNQPVGECRCLRSQDGWGRRIAAFKIGAATDGKRKKADFGAMMSVADIRRRSAGRTKAPQDIGFPIFDTRPRRSLPPEEFCLGANPRNAANSRGPESFDGLRRCAGVKLHRAADAMDARRRLARVAASPVRPPSVHGSENGRPRQPREPARRKPLGHRARGYASPAQSACRSARGRAGL